MAYRGTFETLIDALLTSLSLWANRCTLLVTSLLPIQHSLSCHFTWIINKTNDISQISKPWLQDQGVTYEDGGVCPPSQAPQKVWWVVRSPCLRRTWTWGYCRYLCHGTIHINSFSSVVRRPRCPSLKQPLTKDYIVLHFNQLCKMAFSDLNCTDWTRAG